MQNTCSEGWFDALRKEARLHHERQAFVTLD